MKRKIVPYLLGPLLYLLVQYVLPLEGLSAQGRSVLASTLWVAVWWITEAVEVEVTALLPIVLFPLSGALDLGTTCAAYGHRFVFLFLGGFILAIAIQKWNLHKRIALNIIWRIGDRPDRLILGFMVSTAFLSMWISNSATTVMMLPIALAVSQKLETKEGGGNFTPALLLALAYSASIGGVATLIGTPPNLIFAGVVERLFGLEISFAQWIIVGLPISILLLTLCWFYITRRILHSKKNGNTARATIKAELDALGRFTVEEKWVTVVFVLTAFLWVTRSLFLQELIPGIDDTVIAISAAFILFLLPSSEGRQQLLVWKDAVQLPWGILILFGGGIAIAEGFQQSDLAHWIATNLQALESLSLFGVLILLVAMVNFLTEITSNLATTSVLLPVLAPLAVAIDVAPLFLMVGATLAASCAFMLPVATPPNAIVFGSDRLSLRQMMKAGLWMNLTSIIVITLFVYFALEGLWSGLF